MSAPAPSPITKPSRAASNGRLAPWGSSLRVESAFMLPKPPSPTSVMDASVPPATTVSASPALITIQASPMALLDVAHAETVA